MKDIYRKKILGLGLCYKTVCSMYLTMGHFNLSKLQIILALCEENCTRQAFMPNPDVHLVHLWKTLRVKSPQHEVFNPSSAEASLPSKSHLVCKDFLKPSK